MKIQFIGGVPAPLVDALKKIGYQVFVNGSVQAVDIVHYYNCQVKPLPETAKRTALVREVLPDGVDYSFWNPGVDQKIFRRYSPGTLSLKNLNKTAMQKELGLPVDENIPLVGLMSEEKVLGAGCQVLGPFDDDGLLHKLYAAADIVLVDSPFIAYKYGAMPIDEPDQLKAALKDYENKASFHEKQRQMMALDFSWESVAKKYVSIYVKALKKINISAM